MRWLQHLGTKHILLITGGLIVVLLLVVGVLTIKYTQLKKGTGDQATSDRIVSEVSKIYAVPANEQPTVALVQDKNKLKNQYFFSDVENGDYILVYSGKKIAMVYREREHKLINVGPITLSNSSNPGDKK